MNDTITFGTNSLEMNEELAQKLAETGFDIKQVQSEPTTASKEQREEGEHPEGIWKYRYFKLLEILNTFKRN